MHCRTTNHKPLSHLWWSMSAVGLIAGLLAAGFGLYLLSIWLIEYDRDYHKSAETRLPIPVLTSHVVAAVSGLALWVVYLILDSDRLAWYSLAAFLLAASLGLTMAFRWYGVYRAKRAREREGVNLVALGVGGPGSPAERPQHLGPPERNFPLPVVIVHGLFAFATIALVLLTALGVGGS